MFLLYITILISSVPILNSLRIIKENTTELKENTSQIINKMNQFDVIISDKMKKLNKLLIEINKLNEVYLSN